MKTTNRRELFESEWLNKLAESNKWVALIGYPMAGLVIWIIGLRFTGLNWLSMLLMSALGVLGWTLVEYCMHRFLYHNKLETRLAKRFKYIFHGIHHDEPNREDKLIMPPVPWLVILAIFFGVFYLFTGSYAYAIVPGLVWGYTGYVYIHYHTHLPNPPKWMKNHMIHHQLHHHRHSDKAFGVTTPLWDRVFGTMPPEKIGWNAPRKH